jgi:HD-like signal output (HDOD) protein
MSEQNIFELIKDNRELASLPQVLAEVIRIADDDSAGANELSDVIMKDPALSARVLRIANSPFYGSVREIATINQAVVTLGMRAVKALVLTAGLYQFFDDKKGIVDRQRFWRHSLEVAIASREIANICSYKPAEEAYVTGLLHDIGILIMEASFQEKFRRVWRLVAAGESLVSLEESNWGTNHARVGKFLLDQWKIPRFIGDAVAWHHKNLEEEEGNPKDRLGRIIRLANRISKFRICQMPPLEKEEINSIEKLADSLGIGPTVLSELQERCLSLLIKESEFLDIKIGSVTDLLKDANHLIYKQYLLVESVLRENRAMQKQIARDQLKKTALDYLKTITATLSHYINNASATILGRAQLVELAVSKENIVDRQNIAMESMHIIVKSVEMISLVLEELKKLSSFDITHYHDETAILDIEGKLKKHVAVLEEERKKVITPAG